MKTKVCKRCGKEKIILLFARDRTLKDGRAVYCKMCKRVEINRWFRETTGKGVGKMPGEDWMTLRKVRD